MVIDREELIRQISKIANEVDGGNPDFKGVKCILYTLLGTLESQLPEHMDMLHRICYKFACNMKEDLEKRIAEQEEKHSHLRLLQ